jgi:hypothetical protein
MNEHPTNQGMFPKGTPSDVFALGMSSPSMADPRNGTSSGCGAYCPTNLGSPSGHGNGDGNATCQPGAGTAGNADPMSPPGHFKDGTDANNGPECDGNKAVGQTNPAHTDSRPIS